MLRVTTEISAPVGFSLSECVRSHGWSEVAPYFWDEASGCLTRHDRGGSASVRQVGKGLVVEHDRGDSAAPDRFATVLSFDVDLTELHARCVGHPTLSWVPRLGAGWVLRGLDAWEDAAKGICFTNIAWRQAARCIDRVAEASEDSAWPEPGDLLGRGEDWLRGHARVGYRAPFLIRLAEGFESECFLRSARSREDFVVMPGIGPSTAAYLAGMWGHWDRVSYDSSIAGLLRKRDEILSPSAALAEARYSSFGSMGGLACLLDLHGWVRGLS